MAVLSCCGLLLTAVPAQATILHVAPSGNDEWSGRIARPDRSRHDGPLRTIVGARNRIRQMRALHQTRGPIVVEIDDGLYTLAEPIVFTPQDGGTPDQPITYRAAPHAQPVISGGRALAAPRREGALWTAPLPPGLDAQQLFVDQNRATRARTPNDSLFYLDPSSRPLFGRDPGQLWFVAPHEATIALSKLSVSELHAVELVLFHSWEVSRHHIDHIDHDRIYLTSAPPWPYLQFGKRQRFFLENVRTALDTDGEWFATTTEVYYRPRADAADHPPQMVVPALDHLVIVAGSPQTGWVQFLNFEGLTFEFTGFVVPYSGHADPQAASTVDAAIMVDGGRQIRIERCTVQHTANYAIWFRRGSRQCRISRCVLSDLGAGGVRIGEATIPPSELATHSNIVEDTVISSGGRMFRGAVGIWIGQSGNNQVAHNDISDFYYSGISVGWTWGYGPSAAVSNTIEYNRLHRLGQRVLSDLGGIYTLGVSPGTVLRNNVIFDIASFDEYGEGAWGIYLDEGTSGVLVRDNLVYDTTSGSFHQHYGKGNIIENNIFAFGQKAQLRRSRREDNSFSFRRNIVFWNGSERLFAGVWDDKGFEMGANLFYSHEEANRLPAFLDEARTTGSSFVVVDPGFRNPSARDFHLVEPVTAARVGFREFDFSKAGPRPVTPHGDEP